MRKKSTVWVIALCGIGLIILGLVYYFYLDPNKFDHHYLSNQEKSYPDTLREMDVFTGDKGYFLKGKIIDERIRSRFDKFPDTLSMVEFGDRFYCVSCKMHSELEQNGEVAVAVNSVATAHNDKEIYSLYESARKPGSALSAEEVEDKYKILVSYLQLAESGQVEFPRLSSSTVLDSKTFEDKYKQNFTASYTRNIPEVFREKIIDFLNSEEGKDFEFVTTDQRDHSELIRYGSFTGKGKREMALIVATKPGYSGNHKERLLVFAKNKEGSVYQLYKEDFYDKVLLETTDHENQRNEHVYMGGEEKQFPPFKAIRIKIANQPDVVFTYNTRFDKIERFLQLPKSKINDEEVE